MNNDITTQLLNDFQNALAKLTEVLELSETELVRDAAIQRFEFVFELAWKSLKRILRDKGIFINTPKDAFKEAFKNEWIHNEDLWLSMLEARNLTSHTYKENIAEQVYKELPHYLLSLESLLRTLQTLAV